MIARDSFEFLGERGFLKNRDSWNDPQKSRLWLYNLHYLNDLNAFDADSRHEEHERLVSRWIAENPPAVGNGWEPYPLSLRIVNLIKWLARRDAVQQVWLDSLALQTQALCKQIEYHILGNHLFANAKALIFSGTYLNNENAEKWLEKGLRILDREIAEQFLPDGAHFELSPMYHSILLCDMCDLLRLAECAGSSALQRRESLLRDTIQKGLIWLDAMCHRDGHIAFFNDAAFGVAPEPQAISGYAASVGCQVTQETLGAPYKGGEVSLQRFESSGYYRVGLPGGGAALLDVARIGPDYLPGHAHADTLSFELSLLRQRVFVNSGVSQYGDDAERQRQRGTAAHNTVVVDGENSSEVWGGFRVARRAYPSVTVATANGQSAVVAASHSGYQRLRGRVVHSRRWTFTARSLVLEDEILGGFQSAEAYFHLHPDLTLTRSDLATFQLSVQLGSTYTLGMRFVGASRVEITKSTWHPRFGESVANTCIVIRFAGHVLRTTIDWGAIA